MTMNIVTTERRTQLDGYVFLSLDDTGLSPSLRAGERRLNPLQATLYAMPTLVAFDYDRLSEAAVSLAAERDRISQLLMPVYPTSAWRCANMTEPDDMASWLRDFTVGLRHYESVNLFKDREPELYAAREIVKSAIDTDPELTVPLAAAVGVKSLPVSYDGLRYGEARQLKMMEQEFPMLSVASVANAVRNIVHDIHRICAEWELSRTKRTAPEAVPSLMPESRRAPEPDVGTSVFADVRLRYEPVERLAQAMAMQAVYASRSPAVLRAMQDTEILKKNFVYPALDTLLNDLRAPGRPHTAAPERDVRPKSVPDITGVRSLLVGDALTGAVTAFVFAQYPDGKHGTVMSLTTSREGIMTGGVAHDVLAIPSIDAFVKGSMYNIAKADDVHDAERKTEVEEEIREFVREVHDPDRDGVWDEHPQTALDPKRQDVGPLDEPSM